MKTAKLIVNSGCELGEGPLWNTGESALYWTDILGAAIHRYHPATGKHEVFPVGMTVGAFAFRASGGLVLAAADRFAAWQPGQTPETLAQFAEIGAGQRFNDGKVDPQGRFWAGAMGHGAVNHLYRLDADHTSHMMLDEISISNGIGWSPDERTMYYTDTPTGEIAAFDFEPEYGAISNRRIFAKVEKAIGYPDGLCVDAEGGVWSAVWDGWRVLHFDPSGALTESIDLPVQRPTSCAFGGANLDTLYITSAREGLSTAELAQQPGAGALFAVQAGVRGQEPGLYIEEPLDSAPKKER